MATCGSTIGGSIVNYIINNTAGDAVFVIRQESANGPEETQRNSDLTLYGYRAPNWGEKFNENFYRLAENFAAPSQRGAHSSPPDNVNFSFPHNRPATENDLGTGTDPLDGFGINRPIHGQTWFNTSAVKLYIYNAFTDTWLLIGPCCSAGDCGYGGTYECALLGECGFGGSVECATEYPCFGYGGPVSSASC